MHENAGKEFDLAVVKKQVPFGKHTVTFEVGEIANQATRSVLVRMGEVVVLCCVVAKIQDDGDKGFFPLSVHYFERAYAAGKIPGGFFKREGRPSEKETLTSRLIDRPIRPLFPDNFKHEVQVTCTVLSADPEIDSDIPSMLGTSAALALSGLPFQGPIGAARVGYDNERYFLNPSNEELKSSRLNMVVACTKDAVLMVESEADELTEDQMLGAILFAQNEAEPVIEAINEMVQEFNVEPIVWSGAELNQKCIDLVESKYSAALTEAYSIREKKGRVARIEEIKKQVVTENVVNDSLQDAESAANDSEKQEAFSSADVLGAVAYLEKKIARGRILRGEPRIDGRGLRDIRSLNMKLDFLPGAHGSSVFSRGETQAIVAVTLGSLKDSALVESFYETYKDRFMFHYNFPPFCVGEVGMNFAPKRREIGHGRLARRGLESVLPKLEDFPYTIRVVSEITGSNGSSSMASVCGASLSLMNAGVPISSPVAGIAMGLVKDGNHYAILTDILGDEDHLGDMDFKVVGTSNGITALQMDIKIKGLNENIMEASLKQALEARLDILKQMGQVINAPQDAVASNAPLIEKVQVNPKKIKDLIGKGGANIRKITEETEADIDIEDTGLVTVCAKNRKVFEDVLARIELLTAEVEVGKIYQGKVVRIVDFGAFVNLFPGKDGLVHISQISEERVSSVSDYLSEGEELDVVVLGIDQGKVRLSIKDVDRYRQQQEGEQATSEDGN